MPITIKNTLATTLILILLAAVNHAGHAEEPPAIEPVPVSDAVAPETTFPVLRAALSRIFPDRQIDSIAPAPVPGLYEVIYGADVLYLTEDGKHLIQGDIYALDTRTNVTEAKRAAGRSRIMASIDPDTMIIFKPEKTRYVVSVFTDIDCGYCRKLHSEINSYLSRGIEIRYLAFPRTGVNTPSYFKAVTAWCAKNRQQALTLAKTGADIPFRTCDNPVDEHLAVARELGVSGTPTLVLADGSILPGYVPAKRLERYLDELSHTDPAVTP